jgi:uncharacterized protein with PIN domain
LIRVAALTMGDSFALARIGANEARLLITRLFLTGDNFAETDTESARW